MNLLSRWVSRFCYNHPNFGIPNLMAYVILGNVAVFLGDLVSQGMMSGLLRFYPQLILKGQVWRLVTFALVPESLTIGSLVGILFFALACLFYFYIGTALERQWGATRFTFFYLLGVGLNAITGLVSYWVLVRAFPELSTMYISTAHMGYVNLSLFLSFATLYPDLQVRLYGIIPIKIKWLAWINAGMFAFEIISALIIRSWLGAILPLVAILNYLIFFWSELMDILHRGQRRVAHKVDPKTIQFKQAQRDLRSRKVPLHRCTVCGVTDEDNPNLEFRYCSKCNGYYCYCMDHINNHTHKQ